MVDFDDVSITAAHVPAAEGEGIDNPVRSLAKVELTFTGLRGASGRSFDGVLILHVRDDGGVLGKAHDKPLMLKAIYTDCTDDEPVTDPSDLAVLSQAGEQVVRNHDLASIWQDSRMFALYHEAFAANQVAQKAIAEFEAKNARYRAHIDRHYTPTPDGNIDPKDDTVAYILLDENGQTIDDE